MKKLTAGIFTVMLGLCATSGAEAAVASKGYVDTKVGANAQSITTLTQTVETNATTAANATAAVAKDLADYETANDARVLAVEGEVDSLQTAVGDAESGLVKDVANLSTLVGDKSVSEQIADAVTGGTLDLTDYAKVADLNVTNQNVTANTDAISAINNADTGILAEAKKYADENDADTIYDDTTVKADIAKNAEAIAANETAIESNAGDISGLKTLVGTTAVATQISSAIADANLSQYATTEAMNGALSAYALKANLKALAYKDTVGTDDIDNGAVTAAKLAGGAVTDAAVENGALSQDKINGLGTTLATKLNIPTVANEADGKYVLTATAVNGQATYYWESIAREGED